MEKQPKNNISAGNIRSEFLEIDKLRRADKNDSIGLESYTVSNSGHIFTLICC